MEFIRIKNITEEDFHGIVQAAGGSRIASQGSADYRLNEALIELKLIVEEGFEKASRQAKMASLFQAQQPNAPVVVLNPKTLDATQSRDYYNKQEQVSVLTIDTNPASACTPSAADTPALSNPPSPSPPKP